MNKPRIRKTPCGWQCWNGMLRFSGRSPEEAYSFWKSSTEQMYAYLAQAFMHA